MLLSILTNPATSGTGYGAGEMRVPLEKGQYANKAFSYGNLNFDPVNLFVQERPWTDVSPCVQLELMISEDGEQWNRYFLYYYDEDATYMKSNFPLAWNDLILDLDIAGDDDISLVISELRAGKEFNLGYDSKCSVDGLTVHFEQMITGWSVRPDGGMVNDLRDYYVVISLGKLKESFSFPPLWQYGEDTFDIEWNGWLISITGTYEDYIKVVCFKTDKD